MSASTSHPPVPRRQVLSARALDAQTLALSGVPPEHLLRLVRAVLGPEVVVVTTGDRTLDGSAFDAAAELLSERELAVVRLITRGHGNDAVAHRLFISNNTVKGYVRTAYRKMRVRTRSEAVLWGLRHGLDEH